MNTMKKLTVKSYMNKFDFPLSNFDIIKIIKSNGKLKDKFLGVFDDMGYFDLKNNSCMICNYSNYNDNNGGTHWVGIILKNNILYLLDSLGGPPDDTLQKYFHKNKSIKNIVWINTPLQPDNSSLCGYYCIHFLENLFNKASIENYKKYMEKFDLDNLEYNDKFITNYFAPSY